MNKTCARWERVHRERKMPLWASDTGKESKKEKSCDKSVAASNSEWDTTKEISIPFSFCFFFPQTSQRFVWSWMRAKRPTVWRRKGGSPDEPFLRFPRNGSGQDGSFPSETPSTSCSFLLSFSSTLYRPLFLKIFIFSTSILSQCPRLSKSSPIFPRTSSVRDLSSSSAAPSPTSASSSRSARLSAWVSWLWYVTLSYIQLQIYFSIY